MLEVFRQDGPGELFALLNISTVNFVEVAVKRTYFYHHESVAVFTPSSNVLM